MGRKGGSTGLKRKPAPKFWPIHRKEFMWVVKPSPGSHFGNNCLPITVLLRDYLGFAKTRKEAKTMVSQGRICVDGQIRRDDGFPVGLADVISVPDIDRNFRILPSAKGLVLHPIDGEEAKFKLCRIESKITVKNGNMQLNLHDGSNMFIKVADAKNRQEDTFETLGTVKIALSDKQIVEFLKIKEKDYAIITGGKNIGKHGSIIQIEETTGKKRRNTLVTIEDKKGNRFQTTLAFIFVIGETRPLISLPEAN